MSDESPMTAWRDHDHTAEQAVLHAFEEPTPGNQRAAELAVSLLQRRFDHVLRRIEGGDGEIPPWPSHAHNAADNPVDCLDAVLLDLAGSRQADRAETLAHGLEAAHALGRQLEEARQWARAAVHGAFRADTDDLPEWLTAPLEGRREGM